MTDTRRITFSDKSVNRGESSVNVWPLGTLKKTNNCLRRKMDAPTFWLDLFTAETWQEFHADGAKVSGFRERRRKTVNKMKKGDILLCYLVGQSRFIASLKVTGDPFFDRTKIWSKDDFPARVPVKVIVELSAETGVPVLELKDRLSIFDNLAYPNAWGVHFRGSPVKWSKADGEAVMSALQGAKQYPVVRQLKKAYAVTTKIVPIQTDSGEVTIPENTEDELESTVTNATTVHTEIQWLLLKFGNDLGLSVWVARNDKSRIWAGREPTQLKRLLDRLPTQFDPASTKTIELIDVLWLQGNAIVAAFEIESTTSIYSGLLRMADLISMQPNINIPLFIVAPGERRERVILEINRPTFSSLNVALSEICRFISFEELRAKIADYGGSARYLKPEILEQFSESCRLDDV